MMAVFAISIQDQWEPIVPPGEVAFWPPQPGWYVVIALLLVLLIYFGLRYWKQYKANRYRRLAKMELERMQTVPANLQQLNKVLKAVAIKTFGRDSVASLHGDDWYQFLDDTGPKAKLGSALQAVQNHYATSVEDATVSDAQWQELIQASVLWTKTHK